MIHLLIFESINKFIVDFKIYILGPYSCGITPNNFSANKTTKIPTKIQTFTHLASVYGSDLEKYMCATDLLSVCSIGM